MCFLNHLTKGALTMTSQSGFNRRLRRTPAAAAALLFILALLAGCSGTGTMYTPETTPSEGISGGTAAAETAEGSGIPADTGDSRHGHGSRRRRDGEKPGREGDGEEDARTRRAWLEGTGSDLYTAQAIDSYYQFTLNGASLRLPCSMADLTAAGWRLAADGTQDSAAAAAGNSREEELIPPYSYEFYDAVPADSGTGSFIKKNRDDRTIRLCLANDTDSPLSPDQCAVCGVSANTGGGLSLNTSFGAGLGSKLADLTAVFGTDGSVFSQTDFKDGTRMVRYQFSNGLNEDEQIPVLAEAEEKRIAELLTAQTGTDGSTIQSLSLYYFHLSSN